MNNLYLKEEKETYDNKVNTINSVEIFDLEFMKNTNNSSYDSDSDDNKRYYVVENTKANNEMDEKQTSFKIDKNKKFYSKDKEENANKCTSLEISQKNEEKKNSIIFKKYPPIQYTHDKIKNEIAIKLKNKVKFNEMFKIDENIINIENKMNDETFINPKKRNKKKKKEEKEPQKLGRHKKDEIKKEGKHNCQSQDNVIKKIKSKILYYLNQFINNILNKRISFNKKMDYIKVIKNKFEYEKIILIQDLNYDMTVNETEKEINLRFLKMPLKDFLSINISTKLSTYSKDSNKRIIEEILKNEDDEVIQFILRELTFGDWIEIFIYKKEITDLKNNLTKSQINEIMNNFKRIDYLIEDMDKESKNNKNVCFPIFIILLYNYERWYFIKQGRKKKNNKNLEKIK